MLNCGRVGPRVSCSFRCRGVALPADFLLYVGRSLVSRALGTGLERKALLVSCILLCLIRGLELVEESENANDDRGKNADTHNCVARGFSLRERNLLFVGVAGSWYLGHGDQNSPRMRRRPRVTVTSSLPDRNTTSSARRCSTRKSPRRMKLATTASPWSLMNGTGHDCALGGIRIQIAWPSSKTTSGVNSVRPSTL